MRSKRLLAMAVLLVAAMDVAGAAVASAADPLFLFGTAKTAKLHAVEVKEMTLGGFLESKCKEANGSISISNDSDGFTGELKYAGCATNFGGEMKSLGAVAGVVKIPFEAGSELCWLNERELHVGIWFEVKSPVHIELPLGVLELLSGGEVGTVMPVNTKTRLITIVFKAPGGDPEPASCVGLAGTKMAHLKIIENETGTERDGALEFPKMEVTFESEGQIDG